MLNRLLISLLLCTVGNTQQLTQDAPKPACPIEFNKVRVIPWGTEKRLVIAYTNIGKSDLIGLKFKAYAIDAVGDEHEAPVAFTSGSKTKAGKNHEDRFEGFWLGDDTTSYRVVLIKAAFADGTTWEDATQSCQSSKKRK